MILYWLEFVKYDINEQVSVKINILIFCWCEMIKDNILISYWLELARYNIYDQILIRDKILIFY